MKAASRRPGHGTPAAISRSKGNTSLAGPYQKPCTPYGVLLNGGVIFSYFARIRENRDMDIYERIGERLGDASPKALFLCYVKILNETPTLEHLAF